MFASSSYRCQQGCALRFAWRFTLRHATQLTTEPETRQLAVICETVIFLLRIHCLVNWVLKGKWQRLSHSVVSNEALD
jgi:hypothetical protein